MTRTRRASRLRRLFAGMAGLALLGGAALVPSVPETDAAWTDAEVGAASFAAAEGLPAPVAWGSPQCSASNVLLLGGRVTIRWRVPEEAAGYSLDDVEFGRVVDGVLTPILTDLLGSVNTTGAPEAYTTVVSGGLLSNVLGGSMRFGMRLTGPGDWVSPWLVADVTFPALVGSGTCSLSVVDG